MKHAPSSFSLVLQVGAIMFATVLVVLVFFRIRPSVLPPLTLQESLHTVIERTTPASVMIVDNQGIIWGWVLIDVSTVLTSKHILQIGKKYAVRLSDDEIVWGTPVALHTDLDLALIALDQEQTSFVHPIASQASLQAGDFVLGFGTLPQSRSFIHHFGIISEVGASLTLGNRTLGWLILTDIPFQAWYSGAPLFNLRGELIGINTAFSVGESVGWATPVDAILLTDWRKTLD